jgi:hypothetical protein
VVSGGGRNDQLRRGARAGDGGGECARALYCCWLVGGEMRGSSGSVRYGGAWLNGARRTPPIRCRRQVAATRRAIPVHGRDGAGARERVRASARGGPGRLRPWAEKGGGRPGKKRKAFYLYFSINSPKSLILSTKNSFFKR